jgi:hypothetical protein
VFDFETESSGLKSTGNGIIVDKPLRSENDKTLRFEPKRQEVQGDPLVMANVFSVANRIDLSFVDPFTSYIDIRAADIVLLYKRVGLSPSFIAQNNRGILELDSGAGNMT